MKKPNNFIETYFLYDEDIRKFRYRLKQNLFDIYETRCLKAFDLFRRNKCLESIELLKSFHANDKLIEGMRLYLIGLNLNHLSDYKAAKHQLTASLILLEHTGQKRILFYGYSTLIIVEANLRHKDDLKNNMAKLSKLKRESKNATLQYYQCLLCQYVLEEKPKLGLKAIEKVKAEVSNRLEDFRPFYLVLEFVFHFMLHNHDECYRVLSNYKKIRSTKISSNYNFMKLMLDHIVKDSPLYVYKKDFKDDITLYNQISIIKHLASGEIKEAKSLWSELQQMSPLLYGKPFEYHGDFGLFKAGLLKHQNKTHENIFDLNVLHSIKNVQEKLVYLLENSNAPISKFELADYIWGEEYSEQVENRLKKQISRLKKKYPHPIVQSQGTYWIAKKAA